MHFPGDFERVHNTGLMNDRLAGVISGVGLMLMGGLGGIGTILLAKGS